jgi:hypothetical protein
VKAKEECESADFVKIPKLSFFSKFSTSAMQLEDWHGRTNSTATGVKAVATEAVSKNG